MEYKPETVTQIQKTSKSLWKAVHVERVHHGDGNVTRVLELAGHFVYSSLKMGMRKRRFFEVHGENLSRKIIMEGG